MNGIPTIKIEVEGMRERIQCALAVHGKEFDSMVQSAVDKAFTVENIQHRIDEQVAKALDDAIDSLSEHYAVKAVVQDIVLGSLMKVRDEIERKD
jgi:hypothetical protein